MVIFPNASINHVFFWEMVGVVPRGPSISTVLEAGALLIVALFDLGGFRILRSTSGGRDKAAAPIRDR